MTSMFFKWVGSTTNKNHVGRVSFKELRDDFWFSDPQWEELFPWKSKDYFLNGFSVKTIVLVGIYNQQFKGTILFMVFDFQGFGNVLPNMNEAFQGDISFAKVTLTNIWDTLTHRTHIIIVYHRNSYKRYRFIAVVCLPHGPLNTTRVNSTNNKVPVWVVPLRSNSNHYLEDHPT